MNSSCLPRKHIVVKTRFKLPLIIKVSNALRVEFPDYEIIVMGWGNEGEWTDNYGSASTILPVVKRIVNGFGAKR